MNLPQDFMILMPEDHSTFVFYSLLDYLLISLC